MTYPVRRHLAVHLDSSVTAPLDQWRVRWDPVMLRIAPAHVTVTYPDECHDEAGLLDRARRAAARLGPVRLRLGRIRCVDGGRGGVFAEVDDVDGWLAELRDELLLPPQRDRKVPFHSTIVHPRTSDRGPECWTALAGTELDVACAVAELLFTETKASGRTVLERFRFAAGPSAGATRVVGVALVRDGAVLLGLRAARRASFAGVWDLPGGHVEPGETRRAAARREAEEELGIRAVVGPPLGCVTSDALGVEMTVYRIDDWAGDVVNTAREEHDELRWFRAGEWDGLPLVDTSYGVLLARILAGTRFDERS